MTSAFEERLINAQKQPKACKRRSCKSCLQIIGFFLCLYSFLAGYWALCFYVFYDNFITLDSPVYILEASRIAGLGSPGVKPGLGLVPTLPYEFDFDHGRTYNWHLDENWFGDNITSPNIVWAQKTKEFFEKYQLDLMESNATFCDENDYDYHEDDVCLFDLKRLGSVCSQYPYGYRINSYYGDIQPCLFLKVNKILHFKPEPYDLDKNFTNTPKWVNTRSLEMKMVGQPQKVYVECHATSEREDSKIQGHFLYHPSDAGISFRYFPYHQVGKQASPLIALQLLPTFPRDQEIQMECYVYYKNVIHDRMTRQGLVQFNVKINT